MALTFAAGAADDISERGPLTLHQLHALGLERGTTRARAVTSSLRTSLDSDARFVRLPDGRYDTATRLLVGAVLTTRPRRPPADGVLWLDRDLDPLLALTSEGVLPLATGGELRRGASRAECWTGPTGWLAGAQEAPLIGLRWDGRAVTVEPVVDAVAPDLPEAQAVRRVLARHAGSRHRRSSPYDTWPPLTTVVLSALVEDRELLRRPLPPLSELLPLPEELRPQDCWAEPALDESATTLRLALPTRVHDELARRADLLGERLPDYAALLLGAAADRVLPPAPSARPHYAYDEVSYTEADVVELSRWSR